MRFSALFTLAATTAFLITTQLMTGQAQHAFGNPIPKINDKAPAATPSPVQPAALKNGAADEQPETAAEPPAENAPAAAPEVPKTLSAEISLTNQLMLVYENDELVHSWKISSGAGRWRTPNGEFSPTWVKRMHYSKQWGYAPMPYTVFFHNGYAVHGTHATWALGRPASHGCVRLTKANARTFYNLVRKHGKQATAISVSGVTPKHRAPVSRRSQRRRAKSAEFWPFNL